MLGMGQAIGLIYIARGVFNKLAGKRCALPPPVALRVLIKPPKIFAFHVFLLTAARVRPTVGQKALRVIQSQFLPGNPQSYALCASRKLP